MKKVLLSIITLLFFCLQIAAQESMNIWEGLYRSNEFGESVSKCPYIRALEIAPGSDMSVEIGKCDGMKFICTLPADSYTTATRFAIKTLQDGKVHTFPFNVRNGELYITDSNAINQIIEIMAAGNYIVAITVSNDPMDLGNKEPSTFNAHVGIETMGIKNALQFLNKNSRSNTSGMNKSTDGQSSKSNSLATFFSSNVGKFVFEVNFLGNKELASRMAKLMGQQKYNSWKKHYMKATTICKYDNNGKYGASIYDTVDDYDYYIIFDAPNDNLTIIYAERPSGFDDPNYKYLQEKADRALLNSFEPFE